MGACGSKNGVEDKAGRDIDKTILEDHQHDQSISKLLLLGAGESGKSTLFKQMMAIYGSAFKTEADRLPFKSIIHNNVITSMKMLVKMVPQFGDGGVIACTAEKEHLENSSDDAEVDAKMADALTKLWNDQAVKDTYENRCNFQLTDSAEYFFERAHEMCAPGWIPNRDNVMRARVRTTGIVENDFTIEQNMFKMFDVGGQRNERKKWIHCFENVTAVLFVGVLSEYNLKLYEDDSMNRMEETLNLFDEIINSRWFRETHVILFLNKRDLFAEKIEKYPLTSCSLFESFPVSINTYEGGVEAIKEQFLLKKSCATQKNIYTHVTCATDTGNCKAVFDAVKDIVIRTSLTEAGLV